ncbi:MAG: FHA domain-containing protein [Rhodospirillaceae bacterium]|jgi:hypothetical protein|nr:FHA domain-containing protein [Rhodospirillaceae bacterium]
MKTFVVGRSQYADLRLPDASIAAQHAEVVVTEDGRTHVTDTGSLGGTWRRVAGETGETWTAIRQDFVGADEVLRFGNHTVAVADLLRDLLPKVKGGAGKGGGSGPGGGGDKPRASALKGPVERDPVTGEIVRRRL